MGQKVNPVGLRLGINRTWDSRWFAARGEYGKLLHEDRAIRAHIMKEQREAGISKVVIERPHKKCRVTVMTARPGILIGKKGDKIERLRADLAKLTSSEVHLNILEIRKPEIDATLIAEGIAQQLERRVAFRRAMKRAVQSALRLGAVGIRINVAGRLGGAEIARTEWYREGRVPLHTLRADIDFGYGVARTAYGIIGIKVWVFKGEIIEHDPMASDRKLTEMQESGAPRPRRDDDRGDRRDRRPGRGGRGGGRGPGGGGGAGGGGERAGGLGCRLIDARSVRIPEATHHAATETDEVPQTVQGPHPRRRQVGHDARLRRSGSEGHGAGAPDARQIEAARRAIARHTKRAGRMWLRIFPDVPVSKKPAEVRMGSGKGSPELWVARVKPGRIIFELGGVNQQVAQGSARFSARRSCRSRCRVVTRIE